LCKRLATTPEELTRFVENKEQNVYPFIKTKRNSTKIRTLCNTHPRYKTILKKINKSLLSGPLPIGVLGGVKGKQIVDVAKIHCGKESVFSVDLKDFFPSIKSGQVYTLFKRTGCTPEVCNILTDLVTFEGKLPQGFPTSTSIANWVAYDLDIQHLRYCNDNGIGRTRWVDDITFSGRHEIIQSSIPSLIGAITKHGFKVNNRKTVYSPRGKGVSVVGLDVSSKLPRLPITTINRVKMMIEDCYEFGPEYVGIAYDIDEGKSVRRSLEGCLRYVSKFNPKEAEGMIKTFSDIDWDKKL